MSFDVVVLCVLGMHPSNSLFTPDVTPAAVAQNADGGQGVMFY